VVQSLRIERLTRTTLSGVVEELEFRERLNFVVGPPNSGKTQWFRMLDFLLGDPEPFLKRFPSEDFAKYDKISARICIGRSAFQVERVLHHEGFKTKVSVDNIFYDLRAFQHWLLEQLGYPVVRYPKGVSTLEQNWSELSFRTLYRHIYRQQRFWSDLADRTTPIETSACILQFLGLAKRVYNEDLERLRHLREVADRHAVEIYACRMALSILAGNQSSDTPTADDLERIDPPAIVASIEATLRALERASGPNAPCAGTPVGRKGIDFDERLALARQIGERTEQLRLARVFAAWNQQAGGKLKDANRDIWTLAQKIRLGELSQEVRAKTEILCSAMNEYLHIMRDIDPSLWRHSDVRMIVSRPTDLRLQIGRIYWDRALGGSDSLLFLMAYHYGLLALTARDDCLYPGFLIVDFPAYFRGRKDDEIENFPAGFRGRSVGEIEAMIARPFADLLDRPMFSGCQAIFVGSAFEGEDRAHRIQINTRYHH
jgi:hypothetical protein